MTENDQNDLPTIEQCDLVLQVLQDARGFVGNKHTVHGIYDRIGEAKSLKNRFKNKKFKEGKLSKTRLAKLSAWWQNLKQYLPV